MRALIVKQQGNPVAPNVEYVDDFADPVAGAGGALIRTEASGLNHLDLWVGRGLPGIDLTYPRIGGSDGVGIVEAVGPGGSETWIGKRVMMNAAKTISGQALPGVAPALADTWMIGEHENGAHAEYFVAPVANLLDIGETDPVEAAAFGLAHLTAWRMLCTRAHLRAGMTVLITGIGGGVAVAALNIARHLGCHTIVTSRHQWKLDRARELGADDTILDDGSDWSRAVRAFTAKRGVDICVDSIGKAVHLAAIKSLARGGVFVTCGCTTGPDAVTDLARIFWNQLSIVGSTMGDMDDFRAVTSLLLTSQLHPVIDSVHDAADGRDAYQRLEAGEQFGKVVLRWK
ncbi:MAG: zinc-binding dehydrogenase [Phycisphaerales bacterium]